MVLRYDPFLCSSSSSSSRKVQLQKSEDKRIALVLPASYKWKVHIIISLLILLFTIQYVTCILLIIMSSYDFLLCKFDKCASTMLHITLFIFFIFCFENKLL